MPRFLQPPGGQRALSGTATFCWATTDVCATAARQAFWPTSSTISTPPIRTLSATPSRPGKEWASTRIRLIPALPCSPTPQAEIFRCKPLPRPSTPRKCRLAMSRPRISSAPPARRAPARTWARTNTRPAAPATSRPPSASLRQPPIRASLPGEFQCHGHRHGQRSQRRRHDHRRLRSFKAERKIGNATTNSGGNTWTFTWNAVPQGSYSLTAKATDNSSLSTTSTPVAITVTGSTAQAADGQHHVARRQRDLRPGQQRYDHRDGHPWHCRGFIRDLLSGRDANRAPARTQRRQYLDVHVDCASAAGTYSLDGAFATDANNLSTTSSAVSITVVGDHSPTGTTYYVSNTGNDNNDGKNRRATAWLTIAKVNGSTFNADDWILFQAGGLWREELLIPSSGAAGKPIVFGMYGTGNKPKFSGSEIILTNANFTLVSRDNIWKAVTTYPSETDSRYGAVINDAMCKYLGFYDGPTGPDYTALASTTASVRRSAGRRFERRHRHGESEFIDDVHQHQRLEPNDRRQNIRGLRQQRHYPRQREELLHRARHRRGRLGENRTGLGFPHRGRHQRLTFALRGLQLRRSWNWLCRLRR